MALEELTMLAVGYWLAESRAQSNVRRTDWESAVGFLQDAFDLAWQLLLLVGVGWALQALSLHLPQASLVGLGLILVLAYGLSLLRRRSEGAAVPYFLALTMIVFSAQQGASSGGTKAMGLAMVLLGGSLACEIVLLGLQERLRWSSFPVAGQGVSVSILCLAMMAMIFWCIRF